MLEFGGEEARTLNPYQNAYEQAALDLTELMDRFEQLRSRRQKLENLIEAFRPLFEQNGHSRSTEARFAEPLTHSAESRPALEHETSQEFAGPSDYSFGNVPNPLPDISETGGDPFQRRVRSGYQFRGLGHEQRGAQRSA